MTTAELERSEISEAAHIPIALRIGVTGHRALTNEKILRESVRRVLSRLDEMLTHTPHTYVAVSPLAEGADRIVAQEVLDWGGINCRPSELEAPLPMPADEYARDFSTSESRAEFRQLLARASRSTELDSAMDKFRQDLNDPEAVRNQKAESRRQAYRAVGLWVAENCDVLIAIWDGGKARGVGGTAEILGFTDNISRSVIWIDSETGEIRGERYEDRLLASFRHHDAYNAERLSAAQTTSEVERRFAILTKRAEEAGLDARILQPVRRELLPHLVRAATLVARYRRLYLWVGTLVYVLAAAAVATGTIASLWPEQEWLTVKGDKRIWFEVGQIGVIGLLLAIAFLRQWHRKWIDYRFLAERLRTAMFLLVAGIPCHPPMPLAHQSVSDEWTVSAFRWICTACPAPGPTLSAFDATRRFLTRAWIVDQLGFYMRQRRVQGYWHIGFVVAGWITIVLTLGATIWHASGRYPGGWGPHALAATAIVLPAVGASLAGIRTFREYFRNAKRYESMTRYLSGVAAKLELEKEPTRLKRILVEASEVMMREHMDWRVVMLPMMTL